MDIHDLEAKVQEAHHVVATAENDLAVAHEELEAAEGELDDAKTRKARDEEWEEFCKDKADAHDLAHGDC